jgi:chromosome segregation ATPase
MIRVTRIAALALVWALVPLTAAAQQQPPAEMQEWLMELQQVEARLVELQEEALEEEELSARQAEVTAAVRTAMIEADASIEGHLARLEQIMAEAREAQETGNVERITELTAEAQEIQPAVAQAQADAMARPEIAERVEAFQNALHDRMAAIDPDARTLLERRQELTARIRAAGGGA